MRAAAMLGLGAHRPALRVDNHAIAERIGSSDEWITTRSGIVTRGVAGPDESVVEMGAIAGGKALAAAGVDAEDVGLVLLATCSMPGPLPGGRPWATRWRRARRSAPSSPTPPAPACGTGASCSAAWSPS